MEAAVKIVRPATILAWQRRLEKEKWDCSASWTLKGLQTAIMFFVLHVQTCRLLIARAAFSPNGPCSASYASACALAAGIVEPGSGRRH